MSEARSCKFDYEKLLNKRMRKELYSVGKTAGYVMYFLNVSVEQFLRCVYTAWCSICLFGVSSASDVFFLCSSYPASADMWVAFALCDGG